jgi:tRNA(fMet)-specific endonuclease VapC
MTSYVLDTNILSLILRQNKQVLTQFKTILTPENIILSCPIVWYEIKRGLEATDAKAQSKRFDALFATFVWQDFAQSDWLLAAILWSRRRAQGQPITDGDLLIGVFARNRNAILVTANAKDFAGLGVTLESWSK